MANTSENLCFKVILIGNCKVGKTSFLNYIVGRSISQRNITPTIGVQYAPINIRVGASDVRVNIWDTSGAQQYKSITRSYYRKCHGVIIMFDVTEARSFLDLKMWLREIKNQIKTSKIPKIIIANKYDLVESGQKERAVSEKQVVDFCVEHGLNFRETSAMTGMNVKETFNQFIQSIYDYRNRNNEEQSSEKIYLNSVSLEKEKDKSKSVQPEISGCAKCC